MMTVMTRRRVNGRGSLVQRTNNAALVQRTATALYTVYAVTGRSKNEEMLNQGTSEDAWSAKQSQAVPTETHYAR